MTQITNPKSAYAYTIAGDSDVHTDEEDSEVEVQEDSPILGSVISSQASLLGQARIW